MIFGGENTRTEVGKTLIKMRLMEPDEVRNLGPTDLVYVQDFDFRSQLLIPAYRAMGDGDHLHREKDPQVKVRSVFGGEFHVKVTEVYEEDPLGEEMPVIRSSGSRISSSLFFTGIDPAEAEERLKKALRAEFGPGVVEVWNLRSQSTRDLRWDVYEVRNGWVSEGSGRKSRGSVKEVERRLLARGVRDGHERHYMGKETPGWQLVVDPHQPDTSNIEVL
jgi:hypothetical protein